MKRQKYMPGDKNYQIIFEDEDILVVDKPSGLRTIPDGYQPLLACLAKQLRDEYWQIFVVHRLDKETSGVILFARNAEAHRDLNLQFENHLVTKTYHAICTGFPQWQSITANFPLKVNGDRRHRTIIDYQNGKPAATEFMVLSSNREFHLTEIHPNNGYTHIVRTHAAALAIPLLSDPLYHHPSVPESIQVRLEIIPRVALHAYQLEFAHPSTKEEVRFYVDYPADFARACELTGLQKKTGA